MPTILLVRWRRKRDHRHDRWDGEGRTQPAVLSHCIVLIDMNLASSGDMSQIRIRRRTIGQGESIHLEAARPWKPLKAL